MSPSPSRTLALLFVINLLNALGRPDLIEAACGPNGPGQKPVKDFLAETFATRDPADTQGLNDKRAAKAQLKTTRERLAELQERLYAEGSQALLLVLQAMDTAGKDGIEVEKEDFAAEVAKAAQG